MAIKKIGQGLLRSNNFSSFYRKQPRCANFANLFFECWYIGTGLLVVISRLITFMVAGVLWLGRIDVEFLHPDVKVAGSGLDAIPVAYRRDLLVHEAHLHPYIERLGGMYLLRLRDGDEFGSVAGTTWRCLFATALMPWLVKYKVNVNHDWDLKPMTSSTKKSSQKQPSRDSSTGNSSSLPSNGPTRRRRRTKPKKEYSEAEIAKFQAEVVDFMKKKRGKFSLHVASGNHPSDLYRHLSSQ